MRISPRTFAVGFLQNVAGFLAWSAIPVWAEYEMHAPPWQLGLLPFFTGVTYIVVSLRAGAISDRVPRGGMARAGMVLFAVFCFLAWVVRSVLAVAALGVVNGFGMALIWPALQARIGDESTADDLERNLGDFSLSWSAGKTAGFLVAASALGRLGLDALLLCGALSLALVPVLPARGSGRRTGAAPLVRDDHHPLALRAAFLRAGWRANFAAYGLGSTVVYLYPLVLSASGRPEAHHGIVLATIYSAQTASFWAFGRFAGWRYRFAPVAGWMAAGVAGVLAIGVGAPLAVAVPAGAVLGVALGQAYAASVYYSVHSEEERGARAGVHEAVIGAADFGFPFLGGLAAQATGRTWAPFALAAAAAAAALTLAARGVRRAAVTSARA